MKRVPHDFDVREYFALVLYKKITTVKTKNTKYKKKQSDLVTTTQKTYVAEFAKYIAEPSIPASVLAPPNSLTTIFGISRPLSQ